MPPHRESLLPKLPISLEALPPPEPQGQSPNLLELSPTEQQRALLEVFALK
jgi:hypothetical protein